MRTIRFLLQKEFRQIFRNRSILATILVMPLIQLLILPLAADYEIKNINLCVVDHDHSSWSERLISKITASGYFRLTGYSASYAEGMKQVETDRADLLLEIPAGFEQNLVREEEQSLFMAVNAINGMKASLGSVYLMGIIREFNAGILLQALPSSRYSVVPAVETVVSNRFNIHLNYRVFMVPGILALLVTMVGGFLTSLNIVTEKESGTIEQINVSPIRKHHFIIGKLIPFWVLGHVVFTIGLLVARLVYGIVPAGSLFLLYGFISIYLVAILGFGLLISTISENQQQAMFITFFFFIIFILLGGLFTSIDSMPHWAQVITIFNPVRYLIEVMRMVVLKGSGWHDILPQVRAIALMGAVLNGLAIWNYRKTG